ncbi:MAG: polysaccharide deacetylase family protein [Oscillospiraceae bacterium]|jgi:peptidoglycan-N-acetylmuramic acid deacetylase|nr:polysaccharide deacetylase family protein [Oscillospiraceae bacterium]
MKFLKIFVMFMAFLIALTSCSRAAKNSGSSAAPSSQQPSAPPEDSLPSFETPSGISSALQEDEGRPASGENAPAESSPEEAASITVVAAGETVPGTLGVQQVTWGPGTNVDEQNRPIDPIALQEKYGKLGAYFIAPPASKDIYLTFDEGYENGYTPKILDRLKEKGVKAVFFVTLAYAKSSPELIRRMIDEGHTVGNHSCNHPNMTAIPDETGIAEIRDLHDYISQNFGGYQMWLFRPPEGAFSERTLALTHSAGYISVLWSFAYKDWDPGDQPEETAALNKILSKLHPGAIYLLHAVSKTNTDILPQFIDSAREQGYIFKSFTLPDPFVTN